MTLGHVALALALAAPRGEIVLEPCSVPQVPEPVRCGSFDVRERPGDTASRKLRLRIVLLPARNGKPKLDPVFIFGGGPGQTTTQLAPVWWEWGGRDERDVVLIDPRGTSAQMRLDCKLPGADSDLQGYLTTMFPLQPFMACRDELSRVADLRQYTSVNTVEDFEQIRKAFGYGKINVVGGSGGTRQILVYLRRYPGSIRSAIVDGVAPPGVVPFLEHARSAQDGLDSIIAECGRQTACHAAFPNLRGQLADIESRLLASPAAVTIEHPGTHERVNVTLGWNSFAEALRVMTFYTEYVRQVPRLIDLAHRGDYTAFANTAIASNAGLRGQLRYGLNVSMACSEDAPLVKPGDIERKTRGTYLGDVRAREEMAICEHWPVLPPPPDFADLPTASVPVLLYSGSADPTSPVRFAERAARALPRSRHVVFPGSHGQNNPCSQSIARQFLESASVERLDTSCVAQLHFAQFETK
jgi:pimeloyl-ACP methyl ester carboxylesterase